MSPPVLGLYHGIGDGYMQALLPLPPWLLHKWGIVRVHLVPATHPPIFSPISTIGKSWFFYRLVGIGSLHLYLLVKWKTLSADEFRTNIFSFLWTSLDHIASKKCGAPDIGQKILPPPLPFLAETGASPVELQWEAIRIGGRLLTGETCHQLGDARPDVPLTSLLGIGRRWRTWHYGRQIVER